ncbi:MAG TPA: RNA polymerase sigma factor [Fimbriimonadaceae bacterium]|nr:RNA polymerase sigma factor [Fimbriimonadaceae bacterium]
MDSTTIAIDRSDAPPGASKRTWTALELQQSYYASIFSFFSRRVRPREEAEDLTAATFLAAYQGMNRLRGNDPKLFLYGIARRKLADALRKQRRLTTLNEAHTVGALPLTHDGLAQALKLALAAIPDDQAEALMLQNLEDLSVREIAKVMGRSEKSVKALLQRAKERLRSNSLLKSIAEEINV